MRQLLQVPQGRTDLYEQQNRSLDRILAGIADRAKMKQLMERENAQRQEQRGYEDTQRQEQRDYETAKLKEGRVYEQSENERKKTEGLEGSRNLAGILNQGRTAQSETAPPIERTTGPEGLSSISEGSLDSILKRSRNTGRALFTPEQVAAMPEGAKTKLLEDQFLPKEKKPFETKYIGSDTLGHYSIGEDGKPVQVIQGLGRAETAREEKMYKRDEIDATTGNKYQFMTDRAGKEMPNTRRLVSLGNNGKGTAKTTAGKLTEIADIETALKGYSAFKKLNEDDIKNSVGLFDSWINVVQDVFEHDSDGRAKVMAGIGRIRTNIFSIAGKALTQGELTQLKNLFPDGKELGGDPEFFQKLEDSRIYLEEVVSGRKDALGLQDKQTAPLSGSSNGDRALAAKKRLGLK